MLRTLKDLFDSFAAPAPLDAAATEHQLQLATAVLLVEVMRADPDIGDAERAAAMTALRGKFALTDDEIERLLELATSAAREAYDYQRFTALINRAFDAERKAHIIELMWQVAYADGHLHAHESHVMRKVADLLYIPHADYITAKLRARDAAAPA
ncbi:MAG: TerB family tellurite resistance protein [Pseudomonadota bacterium]|uniref:tellurite resistance TerB family protein n=1 Tax=Methyloversatilis sp. TaxID=2569862 RepID=UPI00273481D7|nr:TerB family tellurite resistance protein [Methyloversatilis sp.]MDP3873428.1 TerB family tellurite resistance protein [Methyloversatilis sp.]